MTNSKTAKKVIISVACILVAAGLCLGIAIARKNDNTETEAAYREYSAVQGNITVGTSESGTASIGRAYITFSASAEVEEVYVKVGSDVKEGDAIAKLNTDDIDDIKAQYESKLLSAKLELEAAQNEREIKLAQAQSTYASTVNNSSSAERTYQLSVEKIQTDITSAEKNIEDLKTQLAEYEQLAESYPDDYAKFSSYDTTYSSFEKTYEGYKDVYRGYEKTLKGYEKELAEIQKQYDEYLEKVAEDWETITEMQNNIERTKEAMLEAKEALDEAEKTATFSDSQQTEGQTSNNSAQKALETAAKNYKKAADEYYAADEAYNSTYKSKYATILMYKESYDAKIEKSETKIEEYKDMMEKYSEMMSEYSDKMNDYKSEFDDFNSDYTDLYGNLDADGIAEKIEKLKSDIDNAEYDLEKLTLNKDDSTLSAQQEMQMSLIEASNAESVYNQTVRQIDKNVSDKQDEYDKLNEEYEAMLENIGDGLYIYADCNGAVSSVNVSEGDTINSNMSVATIMDSSKIYVSVSVAEEDISALSVGQAASVTFSAYENVTVDGEIDTIAVEPSRSSGSVVYEITVKITPNENIKIYEGMTCDVTFLQKQVSNVIYVNIQAVKYKGNGISTVLVYDENGSIIEKEVVTGFTDGRYVEIISGIDVGETVLAESAVNRA